MPQLRIVVTEIETIAGQVRVRWADGLTARPGQFYLALLDEAALLREPLFPASPTDFVVDATHPCAALEPGDVLDLIGPLGAGFALPAGATRLLIVAEQPARVLALMQAALVQHWSVAWHWHNAVPGWAATLLPPDVEFHTGTLTPEAVEWSDMVMVDVPDPAEVAERLRALRPLRPAGFIQALRVPLMPCGVGACQTCWVETQRGRKMACVDGPILPM